jgi:hypothetical protein
LQDIKIKQTRKIIVIESDDWGSIRMPSKEVYRSLLKKGLRVDQCPYNRYDSLASEDDLTGLFNVLMKYKDKTSSGGSVSLPKVTFAKLSGSSRVILPLSVFLKCSIL